TPQTQAQIVWAPQVDESDDFTVTGSHEYPQPGTYVAHVTFTIGGVNQTVGVHSSSGIDAYVRIAGAGNDTPAFILSPYTPDPGKGIPNATGRGTGLLGSGVTNDHSLTVGSLTASVDWGDGTSGPGTVRFISTDAFLVQGAHEYSTEGSYNATITVRD